MEHPRVAATIPGRLRGAGLIMIVGSLPWVLMPFAPLIGGDVSKGIGVTLFGSEPTLAVTTSMLPWLTPVSLMTTVTGLLVYYGRALVPGLVLALVWMVMGIASLSGLFFVAALVAYSIFTGRQRLLRPGSAISPLPYID